MAQPILYTEYEVFCATCGHIGYVQAEGNPKPVSARCARCGRPARTRP